LETSPVTIPKPVALSKPKFSTFDFRRRAYDAMATFNPLSAMSAGAPNDAMGLNHAAPGQTMTMEHFDQDFNFDEAVL
jgi:hypothetical protein